MLPALRKDRDLDLFGENSPFSTFFSDFYDVFGYHNYTDEKGDPVLEIEVPGFNKDNLTVELADGILTIKGERTVKSTGSTQKIYKRFNTARSEQVDAEIKDGVLSLTFKQPEKKKTKIEIK